MQESEAGLEVDESVIKRPPRAKLTADEARKRTEEFPQRRDEFNVSVRKGKKGSLSLQP